MHTWHDKNIQSQVSFSSTCFCYYKKHPNNNTKICPPQSFITDSQYLGTIQICWNLNEHYYYLTSPKSKICQIGTNCSPFQSLNMLPFHIRLEQSLRIRFSKVTIQKKDMAPSVVCGKEVELVQYVCSWSIVGGMIGWVWECTESCIINMK